MAHACLNQYDLAFLKLILELLVTSVVVNDKWNVSLKKKVLGRVNVEALHNLSQLVYSVSNLILIYYAGDLM